jgi:DNA-binding NarL/FixJ family response regulator
MSSYDSVKYHEKLIEEWHDPKDIAQRAAVVILNIHELYGKMAFVVLKMLQNKCKHPKKMRDLCADGTVYCMDCNANLTEDEIFSTKTPTLMKQKVRNRRKIVKKYAKQKMTQGKIARKLNVSLSTIEKDMVSLRS